MSVQLRILGLIILSCLSFARIADAETYYLENAKAETGLKDILGRVDSTALDYMLGEDKNMIGVKREESDFFLQPRVIRAGKGFVIKIEKRNKAGKIVSVKQTKVPKPEDMNKAIAKTVAESIGKVIPKEL